MGKYMRKAKMAGEIALMEVAHRPTPGVRTRARTLALRRLQSPAATVSIPTPPVDPAAGSYMQLRSRRLEKPPPAAARPKVAAEPGATSVAGAASEANSARAAKLGLSRKGVREKQEAAADASLGSGGMEASFGESMPEEMEGRDSLVTTHRAMLGNAPTTEEMESFFADAEQSQQRIFARKYNFDPVNDCPLPGRYEWVEFGC